MTGLANLVRLHFWNVGEMRQRFDQQVQLCDRLKDEVARIEQGLEAERRVASRTLDGGLAYQTFVAPALERHRKLREAVAYHEREVEAARADVDTAFQDLKVYETARVLQEQHMIALRENRAQLPLDDPGVSLYRRHAAGEG